MFGKSPAMMGIQIQEEEQDGDSKPPSRHDIRYYDLYELQSSFASKALDSSENDQPVHILCSTTKGRCNEEDGNDRKKNDVPTCIAYLSVTNEHTTQKLPGHTNKIREKRSMRLVSIRCIKLVSINFVGNFIRLLTVLPNYNSSFPLRDNNQQSSCYDSLKRSELQIKPSMQKVSGKRIGSRHMSEFSEYVSRLIKNFLEMLTWSSASRNTEQKKLLGL